MAIQIRKPASAFSLDPSDRSQKRIRDEAHLAFIRSLPSVISGRTGCEACHIRYGDPMYRKKHTGKSQKSDDAWTVPMTSAEHRSQHDDNERDWFAKRGIDPLALARDLYAVTGNRASAVAIINAGLARAGRLREGNNHET